MRRRFRRGNEVRELAVLVGDFTSIDDPQAQQTLERIKSLQPDALNVDADQTAQSMAEVRRWQEAVLEKLGKSQKRGPMGQAFFTRNPLLPREYFVPKGVDPFVAKMNAGVEHSLLECPGKFTIQVATFRGKTILQTSAKDDQADKFVLEPAKERQTTIRWWKRPRTPICSPRSCALTAGRRTSSTTAPRGSHTGASTQRRSFLAIVLRKSSAMPWKQALI